MKLKKLILAGFKSFADRTQFDFHSGISCVVGPNGCGKSNVVDAVKWVLGERSAKSLRGSEMMDVIFNGAANRKPATFAEVSLVFDNASGRLVPAEGGETPAEVAVTRRLFRDGNSEYLINKTPCRLKDILEMFMDTGVGADAYSLIEQGQVDGFLQASQEDRRCIFDEAAGVSRYKARRKEALRKLERVEQNLLRLMDVVGEVDKQLRSVKHQAGKARNYQTYSQRLTELRSLHVLAQYHGQSQKRSELRRTLDAASDRLAGVHSRITGLESARSAAEVEAADLDRAARDVQGRLAALEGLITAAVQRAEMLAARSVELEEHIAGATGRCQEIQQKIDFSAAELAARSGEIDQIEAHASELAARCETATRENAQGELELAQLEAALEDAKAGAFDLMRRSVGLHNEIQGLGLKRENLNSQRSRLGDRAGEIAREVEGRLADHAQWTGRLAEVQQRLEQTKAKHEQTRQEAVQLSESEQKLRRQLGDAREQRSAVQSRCDALTEMQLRHEGVAAGVRRILDAKAKGSFDAILGMLGDFLETDVEHALLVEAALAGAEQQLLAERFDAVQACSGDLARLLGEGGSAEILCLDRLPALVSDADTAAMAGLDGVVGRLMPFVRCEAVAAPAAWRLLGRTIIVRDLAAASSAAAALAGNWRFVTQAGEVLEADGRIRVGSARATGGVISRRSELNRLHQQQAELDRQIAELSDRCATTHAEREHLEQVDQNLRQAIYEANTERVECNGKISQIDERLAALRREQPVVAKDIERLAAQIAVAAASEEDARRRFAEIEQLKADRQQEVEQLAARIASSREARAAATAKLTELKVALAEAEQKRLAMREARQALLRQRAALEEDLAAAQSAAELDRQRLDDCRKGITASQCEEQRNRQQQQTLKDEAAELAESQQGLRQRLEQIRQEEHRLRAEQEQAAAEAANLRVELGEAEVRIEELIARANEMRMDLAAAYERYQHDEQRDWAAVEAEIGDLRGKIERLGNVNMDAIAEQDSLEHRQKFLAEQLGDIRTSQEELNNLIRKLNKESREKFQQSFEAIRAQFQDLFRKLFGGGKADIFLTDPQDVLESPIEVVARPPGKELRSISLLSGGEKTMTAIALLFSIFRSRPSPFCILDEVDAALDEANVHRFGDLVDEFVTDSQFIIITHNKRTMSKAGVLYGVTMQEPGVSKRISVKFDDAGRKLDEQLQTA